MQIALIFRSRLDYFQKLIELSWFFFQEPSLLNQPELLSLKQELTALDK